MKRKFMPAFVLSTLAGAGLLGSPAAAQMTGHQMIGPQITAGMQVVPVQMNGAPMVCGKRTDLVQQLDEKYGETRRSLGVTAGRGLVELYASEETGSWTILVTTPQGTACLMAAGQAFQIDPEKVAGDPI